MHYADGQDVKTGDLIIYEDQMRQVAGILTSASRLSTSCNGTILPLASRSKSDLGLGHWQPVHGSDWYVTLSNCVAVDFENIAEFRPAPPPAAAAAVIPISGGGENASAAGVA